MLIGQIAENSVPEKEYLTVASWDGDLLNDGRCKKMTIWNIKCVEKHSDMKLTADLATRHPLKPSISLGDKAQYDISVYKALQLSGCCYAVAVVTQLRSYPPSGAILTTTIRINHQVWRQVSSTVGHTRHDAYGTLILLYF